MIATTKQTTVITREFGTLDGLLLYSSLSLDGEEDGTSVVVLRLVDIA